MRRKKIRLNGKTVDDYSEEEFEVIVADAEVDVWNGYAKDGLGALAAVFGFNLF